MRHQAANQWIPAGVELEEAGEKWRAGDAAKSMRFFMRAIANYDEGLQKHPGAFDLAYNKYVFLLELPSYSIRIIPQDCSNRQTFIV